MTTITPPGMKLPRFEPARLFRGKTHRVHRESQALEARIDALESRIDALKTEHAPQGTEPA